MRPDWSTAPPRFYKVINVLTGHAVSPKRLANNHESCKDLRIGHGLEPKIFWSVLNGRGYRGEALVFLETLILMGDWGRQETDTDKPKETTAKEEKSMTVSDP